MRSTVSEYCELFIVLDNNDTLMANPIVKMNQNNTVY